MSNISFRVHSLEKSLNELKCLVTSLLSSSSDHQRTQKTARLPSWAQDITKAISRLSEQVSEIKQALDHPIYSCNDDNSGTNDRGATPRRPRQSKQGKQLGKQRPLITQSPEEDSVRNDSGLESSRGGSLTQQVQLSTEDSSSENPDGTASAETGSETANTTPEPVSSIQPTGAQRTSDFRLLVKETGGNLVANVMQFTANPQFSGRISITDVMEVDWASLAKLIQPPPKNYDLLGVTYSAIEVRGAAGLALSPLRRFRFPDFSQGITEPSLEESLNCLGQLINDPPKGSIPYYVGPPLHNGPLMSKVHSILHPGPELLKLGPIDGLNSVFWHAGEKWSGTAYHLEDARNLYSINKVFCGWKLWIKIRTSHTAKFEAFVRANWPTNNCDQFVRHVGVIIGLERLREEKIEFDIILAGPGDMVLTYPRQYHMVINITANFALSINFLPPGQAFVPKDTCVCPRCGLYSLEHEGLQRVPYTPIDATGRANDATVSSRECTRSTGRKRPTEDHTSQQLQVRTKRPKVHTPQTPQTLNEVKERILGADKLCKFPPLRGKLPSVAAFTAVAAIWSRPAITQFCALVRSMRDIDTHSPRIEGCADLSTCTRIEQCVRRINVAQKRSTLETFLLRLNQFRLVQLIERLRGSRERTSPTKLRWIREKAGWNDQKFRWQRQQGTLWKQLCQGDDSLLCFIFLEENTELGVYPDMYRQMTTEDIATFHRLLDSDYTDSLRSAGRAFVSALDSRAADSDFLWERGSFAPDTLPEKDLVVMLRSFPSIQENFYDPEQYLDWPRPPEWPEEWPWPVDPTALLDSSRVQCDVCGSKTSCSCIAANSKPMPRIKDYGKKGRGLQAVANGPGEFAYLEGETIGQLTGELAPLGTYDDGWTLELVRGDLPGEPSVCQIHCADTGNCFRLLNHHCNSNAHYRGMAVSGRYRIMVQAARHILDGEEITVQYGSDYWGERRCPCDAHSSG